MIQFPIDTPISLVCGPVLAVAEDDSESPWVGSLTIRYKVMGDAEYQSVSVTTDADGMGYYNMVADRVGVWTYYSIATEAPFGVSDDEFFEVKPRPS